MNRENIGQIVRNVLNAVITGAPVVTIDGREDAPVIIPPRDALFLVATAEISPQSPDGI